MKVFKSSNTSDLKNSRSNPQTTKAPNTIFDIKNTTAEYDTGTFKQLPRLREPSPEVETFENLSCDNCRTFQQKYLRSEQQRLELQEEVNRLTAKIDNIRRLQEVGVLKSQ